MGNGGWCGARVDRWKRRRRRQRRQWGVGSRDHRRGRRGARGGAADGREGRGGHSSSSSALHDVLGVRFGVVFVWVVCFLRGGCWEAIVGAGLGAVSTTFFPPRIRIFISMWTTAVVKWDVLRRMGMGRRSRSPLLLCIPRNARTTRRRRRRVFVWEWMWRVGPQRDFRSLFIRIRRTRYGNGGTGRKRSRRR